MSLKIIQHSLDEMCCNDDLPIRYFRVRYNNGVPTGRFSCNEPVQAAQKAFQTIAKQNDIVKLDIPFRFELVECTRGHPKNTYCFEGVYKISKEISNIDSYNVIEIKDTNDEKKQNE